MSIAQAAENFINGSRSDVKAALQAMQPLEAAAFAVRVHGSLHSPEDRNAFFRWIQAIVD